VKEKDGCTGRRKDANGEQKSEKMKEKTKKKQDGEEEERELEIEEQEDCEVVEDKKINWKTNEKNKKKGNTEMETTENMLKTSSV